MARGDLFTFSITHFNVFAHTSRGGPDSLRFSSSRTEPGSAALSVSIFAAISGVARVGDDAVCGLPRRQLVI